MSRAAREFLQSTTEKLDAVLGSLTQEEQHNLLDALAAKIEERLGKIIESDDGSDHHRSTYCIPYGRRI